MRWRIPPALVLFALLSAGCAHEKPRDNVAVPRALHQRTAATLDCQYLLYLPRDYAARPGERRPLLLFLHGAGERGTNVWRAGLHGPARYISAHPDFPFVVLTPLCPSNQIWSGQTLCALLDETIRRYRIDTNRVYLTGLSMGGFGTWDLALTWPERFAAVIPIAGGGSDLPIILARIGYVSPEKTAALKSLAFWAFHGANDAVVPPDDSERMISALQQAGVAEAKITIYPDATHNSWDKTYNNPGIYDWLLQHSRTAKH
jgi:predicted peptidase